MTTMSGTVLMKTSAQNDKSFVVFQKVAVQTQTQATTMNTLMKTMDLVSMLKYFLGKQEAMVVVVKHVVVEHNPDQ